MIRATIIKVLNGAVRLFSADGRSPGEFTDRELLQHYGISSRPLSGAEIIIIREGNHFVSIADGDRRYQIELLEGEVALHDDRGQKVHLTRTGIVAAAIGDLEASATESATVTSPTVTVVASTSVTLQTPAVTCTGTLHADGSITSDADVRAAGHVSDDLAGTKTMAGMRATYNSHTHVEVGVFGNPATTGPSAAQ